MSAAALSTVQNSQRSGPPRGAGRLVVPMEGDDIAGQIVCQSAIHSAPGAEVDASEHRPGRATHGRGTPHRLDVPGLEQIP